LDYNDRGPDEIGRSSIDVALKKNSASVERKSTIKGGVNNRAVK